MGDVKKKRVSYTSQPTSRMRLSYIVTMNGERAGRQLQLFGLYLYMDTTDTSSMLLHMLSPCIDYAL